MGFRALPGAFIFVVLALGLLAAACSSEDPTAAPTVTSGDTMMTYRGEVAVNGSSTVFPISEAMQVEFKAVQPDVKVNVGSTGTGAGGKAMCAGEIEIWDASRPSKQSELDTCAEAGIEVIEIPVAFDALSVVVNPDNDWVECLSVEELATIFGPEAQGTVTNWNQVNADFPDVNLRLYGPTPASGTFDYFTEAIMDEGGAHRVPTSPLDAFTVLPVQIYSWVGKPLPAFQENAAAGIIVLLTVLLLMNAVAITLRTFTLGGADGNQKGCESAPSQRGGIQGRFVKGRFFRAGNRHQGASGILRKPPCGEGQ